MAQTKLDLDDSPRTKVFRAIDGILRADPTLKRLFAKPCQFRSWQGTPDDAKPFTTDLAPAIRLTPLPGGPPDVWYSPDARQGTLAIRVELYLKGSNLDDLHNVWYAVKRALYTTSAAGLQAIANTLQAAGADTGMVDFQDPVPNLEALTNTPNIIDAVAALSVEVWEQLNAPDEPITTI
jgi:hypothetical protein